MAKTLGDLTLAIVKASGRALVRAGKRAFDFRQPALPGILPGQGQDLPALPPGKRENPALAETEKVLSKSTDWRKSRIWMWISGGGLKGFLGARRYWAQTARYFMDALGRLAWTFRIAAIEPLKFATRYAALMSTAFADFRRFRDAGLLIRPHKPTLKRIFRHCALPPIAGGFVMLAETLILDRTIGLPTWLYTLDNVSGVAALMFPIMLWYWCLEDLPRRHPWEKWPLEEEIEKIRNGMMAGFAIPAFVHSAPGSLAGCVLYTFFGQAAGQNTCSGSSLSSVISNSTVLANLPTAVSVVASTVSVLALFLLSLTYGYFIVQAMHTAAHTGDWTHQGVNAAWAPIRGATSFGMIAAPGGLSILATFVLFVAGTGNGLGDTAAVKVANMLTAPKPAAVVPPDIQSVVNNALFSLVCAHVLDNFINPDGSVQAVTAQMDNFGNLGFSNVTGTGSYGPNVCGDYMLPGSALGQTMAQNTAFMSLIRQGGPLDQVATAIAAGADGCGSIVIGTGLSPCAPPGTPPNRSVFGQGGGLTNPAAGNTGTLTQVATQYMNSLSQMSVNVSGTRGNALQDIPTDGWVSLGGYYSFFGSQARRAAQTEEYIPIPTNGFGGADWTSIANTSEAHEIQKAFGLTQTYLTTWGFSGSGGTGPWWAATPQSSTGPGAEQAKIQSLSTVQNSSGQSVSVPDYMSSNPGEDPLSRLQNVVESADTALAVGQAARAGLANRYIRGALAAGATAVAGPAAGAGVAVLGGMAAKAAKPILDPLTTVMGILTVVVAVYLPLVPMLAILFYSLFWILEVVILAVFAPLWALAVGIPQGEGFIGQHGKEGLSRVTDVALRPLLLVGMFVISLGLYFLASALLVPMTSQVLAGMSSNPSPGIWISAAGLIGGYLAYTLVLWRVIHFAFEILHTGPFWAMRVLGIDGGQRREDRHIEAGGKEILNNVRTVVQGFRGFGGGGGKGGQA